MEKKMIVQKQTSKIIHNLDEAIMTKSSEGLNFCNKNGREIMDEINQILNIQKG